jgi:hypothetical protein
VTSSSPSRQAPRAGQARDKGQWGRGDKLMLLRSTMRVTVEGPVLRIQDVYPGSRILIFTDPGSKNSYKREGWKKLVVIPYL